MGIKKNKIKLFSELCILLLSVIIILSLTTPFLGWVDIAITDDSIDSVKRIANSIEKGNNLFLFYGLDYDQINNIMVHVYNDENTIDLNDTYTNKMVGSLSLVTMSRKKEDTKTMWTRIDTVCDDFIAKNITSDMTDYEKALKVHDWICNTVEYVEAEDSNDQNIYGALIEHRAVCAGYAKSFAYILKKLDIECEVVSGRTFNGESHAWNKAIIDGNECYFDLTWDDEETRNKIISHYWFGVSGEDIKRSRNQDKEYELGSLEISSSNYYVKNGYYVDAANVKNMVKQIKKQGETFSIKCSDFNVFTNFINMLKNKSEMEKVMIAMGYGHINIKYYASEASLCIDVYIT